MTAREESQCFNDGRLAFRRGVEIGANPRRGSAQRAAWRRGYEQERGMAAGETATPAERQEARRVVGNLKAWPEQNL